MSRPKRFAFSLVIVYVCNNQHQAAVGEGVSLPMSPDPDPIKILTTDAEVAGWNSDGLPNDQVRLCAPRPSSYPRNTAVCVLFLYANGLIANAEQVSTENGAIVTNSARWPLIIDPQLQVKFYVLQILTQNGWVEGE